MKRISILGSTGSIGTSALKVIEAHPDRFKVVGLAEGHDVELLAEQIELHAPEIVSVRDSDSVERLKMLLGRCRPKIVSGIDGACEVASWGNADIVLSAIVGSIGLSPTLAALEAGKDVALANKESLVLGGGLVMELVKKKKVRLLPVDSEHSAIFQSLQGHRAEDVEKIILTASGGPFRGFTRDELEKVTVDRALKHPRWQMGKKITIDSATLMNKALEIIEAHWLFGIGHDKIDVLVHPQSIVHSMVEYKDGCVVAELGVPDMCAPIAYALSYPERIETHVEKLDLSKSKELTFEKPDVEVFSSIRLAHEALKAGKTMPAALNAANEVAVYAFLEGKIKFTRITEIVEDVMAQHRVGAGNSLAELIETDRWGREEAKKQMTRRG